MARDGSSCTSMRSRRPPRRFWASSRCWRERWSDQAPGAGSAVSCASDSPHVDTDGLTEAQVALAYDPQTSGGLLVSLPADKAPVLQAEFESRKLSVCRVGHVVEGSGVLLH